ncbi:aminomethyl-transferring glycine dehydrogenase subunit GcvPA [Shimazuella sp. AN120528]|uniref:aminomethyl-transferring glycine dehydrogenase subunit GcvPA n=1 Tax=Shimazuella soli TaxID=1892854 RepID=UPI001F0FE138|nr:aminomethyl-transferring glycine dehydrogenase subunit GcvPA [Shimazuella soli]MCH5584145.1 aminomethyl-transferring glycine dehydrogenase subunit GcvPA [Shimazuella soli]
MKQRYLPMTEKDRTEMLATIGVDTVEDLFHEIPASVRFQGEMKIPAPMAESTLVRHMRQLASKNISTNTHASFLGAGVYDHHIPSVVGHVISRSEFYTAYTPYQPEISQGELQAIFEFQTMIAELTGMDVANSSMYDGPTALAEAANLASGVTKRKQILISRTVHPEAREILQTSSHGLGLEIIEIPYKDGITDISALEELVSSQTAAVIVQSPNFFGHLEDLTAMEKLAHRDKSLLVVSSNPNSLGMLKPPGQYGADIVVGDAQPLGISASFGGPHCGFFATTKALMRRIPGRIVGETVDEDGNRGFVLTLQAREQHIRRDKATSNICSNQALNALAASVYMSAMGKEGMQEVARQNFHKAHYARQELSKIDGVEVVFSTPFYNEFVVQLSKPIKEINHKLLSYGIIGGYDLGTSYPELADHMLLAVTEERTKEDIAALCQALEELLV